jgi:hypothetical protein
MTAEEANQAIDKARHVVDCRRAGDRGRARFRAAFEAWIMEASWKPPAPLGLPQPPSPRSKSPVNTGSPPAEPSSTNPRPDLSRRRSPVRIRLGVFDEAPVNGRCDQSEAEAVSVNSDSGNDRGQPSGPYVSLLGASDCRYPLELAGASGRTATTHSPCSRVAAHRAGIYPPRASSAGVAAVRDPSRAVIAVASPNRVERGARGSVQSLRSSWSGALTPTPGRSIVRSTGS